jgi:ADP-ribosylglycohydrolase/protein-tyrosine phosphatase
MARTSHSHPLRIDELPWPGGGGVIGLTFCPGKRDHGAMTGAWERDLEVDLDAVRAWGAHAVVTLMELHELDTLQVPGLGEAVTQRGMAWLHLPITDVDVPDARFEGPWTLEGRRLRERLARGERVLLHCRGGLGRTGLVAARLLAEEGAPALEAIAQVRRVRAGAIETPAQEAHVRGVRHQPRPLTLRERARGCLLGGAVGDALGAPVEFMSRAEIVRRFGPAGITELATAYGRLGAVTDDTQMTLWTAEGLIRAWVRAQLKGISSLEGCVGHAYLRWLCTQGHTPRPEVRPSEDGWLWQERDLWHVRAPGNTCLAALEQATCFGAQADNDRKGCGGVMRAAPAGLLRGQGAAAFEAGCQVARLTHGHPSGYLSAGVLAAWIAGLDEGMALRAALERARAELRQHDGHLEVLQAIDRAVDLAAIGRADVVPAALGEGWVAEEALAIAIWCVLVGHDFRDAVQLAVNHGGDSDSTGSIAGQVLGAQHGPAVIPSSWLAAVELREVTTRLADDLAAALGGEADAEALWAAGYPGT